METLTKNATMMPLGLLGAGETAEILEVRFSGRQCRLEDMGLRLGKKVEVLSPGRPGPLLLKVDGSRIAIGHGMAMKIMVKRTEQ